MPSRFGTRKEPRSYLYGEPLSRERRARRDLIRGRLFADDEDESGDIPVQIPPRRSRSESRKPASKKATKKKRISRSLNGLSEMRKSLMRRASAGETPPPSPAIQQKRITHNITPEAKRAEEGREGVEKERVQTRRRSRSETRGGSPPERKPKRRSSSLTGIADVAKTVIRKASNIVTPPSSPHQMKKKQPDEIMLDAPRRLGNGAEETTELPKRRSRSETRVPPKTRKNKRRSNSLVALTDKTKNVLRRAGGRGYSPPAPLHHTPPKKKNPDEIMANALRRVQERKQKREMDRQQQQPKRRSRSLSREPPEQRREKRRSSSLTKLADLRESVLRSAGYSPPPSRRTSGVAISPPPSPSKKTKPNDKKSPKAFNLPQRRMTNREYFMETIMMEDDGYENYVYDSDSGDGRGSTSSTEGPTANIFQRGLLALERIYLE